MSGDTSRLPEIVDATAAIAAAYVPGVRSVFGVGSGLVTIPTGGVQAGTLVAAFPGLPGESWQHVSNLPGGTATFRSATVTEVTWDLPMRLYVQEVDEPELRRRAIGLYFAYLQAFSQHLQLLGRIKSGAIARMTFTVGVERPWAFLELHIPLVERLNLENKA